LADDLPLPERSRHTSGGERFRKAFLLILVVGISLLFLMVIRPFLLSVLLAAILAGLAYPLYRWIRNRLGDRENLAAVATLLVLLVGVGLPLAGFLALVANEAVQVSQGAEAWFQEQDDLIAEARAWVERLPYADRWLPEQGELATQLRSVIERIGPMLMGKLAAVTRVTLAFFLQLFVLLYALFFFLVDGPEILRTIMRYLPLGPEQEEALLERFVSVTRATLKGSLLIGVIQGALAGVAFWIAGVPGAAFWGTVMVVLSIIPALGAAFVWVPAVIYLFVVGEVAAGVGLLIWCAIVVSTVDNFLRPRLVGRDARMSDLLILLSTLGGIVLFGAVGFIVGPIVAALFVTIWHIYGETFDDWLLPVPESLRVRIEAEERGDDAAPLPPPAD
jgi:predicted PurR-regulated permease PerM